MYPAEQPTAYLLLEVREGPPYLPSPTTNHNPLFITQRPTDDRGDAAAATRIFRGGGSRRRPRGRAGSSAGRWTSEDASTSPGTRRGVQGAHGVVVGRRSSPVFRTHLQILGRDLGARRVCSRRHDTSFIVRGQPRQSRVISVRTRVASVRTRVASGGRVAFVRTRRLRRARAHLLGCLPSSRARRHL